MRRAYISYSILLIKCTPKLDGLYIQQILTRVREIKTVYICVCVCVFIVIVVLFTTLAQEATS